VFNDMNQYVGVLAYMEPTYLIPVVCQAKSSSLCYTLIANTTLCGVRESNNAQN